MSSTNFAIWIISFSSVVAMLLRPRGIAEAWWACGGAGLLVLSGLLGLPQAMHAAGEGVDVYLFLAGMMILSELAREKGVFDWVAQWAAYHADGSTSRLFLLVYSAGTVTTAFLSNDATAVVLTPAVLVIVKLLNVDPKPHLLACAFIANAASFVFPISNPANLVIFGRHMPPLDQWLKSFLLPSAVSVLITFLCLRLLLHPTLRAPIKETVGRSSLSFDGKLALVGLGISGAVLIVASALNWPLGLPTLSAAILATLLVMTRDKTIPTQVLKGVSWSVIPLVAGLFMIVEALQSTGLMRLVEKALTSADQLGHLMAKFVTAFALALLSNVINNLPVGLIGGAALRAPDAPSGLSQAVLIGVDLGPNLSVTGSLATILWLIVLRRENIKITAWEFFRIGVIAMPLALIASILALWLQSQFPE